VRVPDALQAGDPGQPGDGAQQTSSGPFTERTLALNQRSVTDQSTDNELPPGGTLLLDEWSNSTCQSTRVRSDSGEHVGASAFVGRFRHQARASHHLCASPSSGVRSIISAW
jgi:hypothetical protein